MKRLLFITNTSRGIMTVAASTMSTARSMGYEVYLAANFSDFDDDHSKFGVTIHHIDLVRNPFAVKNIRAYREMLSIMRRERFDVIHCNTPIGGLLGRLCGKKAKVPKIIYTVHGFHFYRGAPLVNRTLFKWAEKWLARYTDAIITINKEDYQAAQQFRLRKGGKVYYVPGIGVDTQRYADAKSKRAMVIKETDACESDVLMISVGELNKNKNHETVVRALAKLKQENIHFLICGKGPSGDRLVLLAKKMGIGKNVHFLGFRNDVPELLKSCDIFVMSSYREGLPRSTMEAMASGLPCVVSKIRGNVDLIEEGQGGYLCPPDDIRCFSEAIRALASSESTRKALGLRNSKRIQEFDVERIKQIMIEIYSEVLLDENHFEEM